MNKFLLSAVTAAALFGVSSGAAQAACGDISLSVFSWQSAEAMANVDQLILSAGYGCNATTVAGDTVPTITAMIEKARVSPRGSTPRLSSVVMSSAEQNHLVAFVSAGETTAEMDYGVCLGTTPSGDMTVLSSLQNQAVTVKACMMVGSYELRDIPRVSQEKIDATIQARRNVTAADAMSPKLTPAEYWKLQYSYAPEYLAKVMQQVEETAVA